MSWDYPTLRRLVAGERLPAMIVDLDAFEANVDRLAAIAAAGGKTLRVASKSIRVPDLMRRIQARAGAAQGLMVYSPAEARALAADGFDDLLVAYPRVEEADLEDLHAVAANGGTAVLMIDSVEHVERIEAYAGRGSGTPLPVCIDLDVSYRPFRLHMGAQRSPLRSTADFASLVDRVLASDHCRLAGVMGYEAQVAGVPDRSPFEKARGAAVRAMKSRSIRDVAHKRRAAAEVLRDRGVEGHFFNAGGTGSLATSASEPWVTEVTAGSGFLQSHLFDYYGANRNEPAFAYALRVTRVPQPGIVTCQGGGFIASGQPGPDKAPQPFLPAGLKAVDGEGFGEVQTPLRVPKGAAVGVGDPVFCRPAKAGEPAERFQEYLLVRGGEIVDRAPTYRGLGHCFH